MAYRLSLFRKYRSPLRKKLQQWYNKKLYAKSKPPSTSTLISSNRVCIKEGKERILNYLAKQPKAIPLSWSKVKMGCLSGAFINKYTRYEWEPLKKWYYELHQEHMVTFHGCNPNSKGFKNSPLDVVSRSQTIDSVYLPLASSELESLPEKKLGQLLINVFEELKKTVLSIKESSFVIYHHQTFFDYFTPNVLLASCLLNHNAKRLDIM